MKFLLEIPRTFLPRTELKNTRALCFFSAKMLLTKFNLVTKFSPMIHHGETETENTRTRKKGNEYIVGDNEISVRAVDPPRD